MDETGLVADCLEGLRAALPAGTEVEVRPGGLLQRAAPIDGWLEVIGPWGRVDLPFALKRRVNNATVALLEQRFREVQGPRREGVPTWLLLTEYVNAEQARRLREAGVAFADTRGNAHVRGEGLYVWVVGNRPTTRRLQTSGLTRPAAARVLFVLLQDPRRARQPYRELAALAEVAPDTVNRVFNGLQEKVLLKTWGEKERELARVPELAELWTLAYGDGLRPKLRPRRCQWTVGGPMADFLDVLRGERTTHGALLGGEGAAALLTDTIRPTRATLHVPHDDRRDVMRALALVPMPDGRITLLDTFGTTNEWRPPRGAPTGLVDPLLIHAELLGEDDDRATAVAAEIYDSYIVKRFEDAQRT